MFQRLWFELNKPRKMYDLTNLVGYAIIAYMVTSLNTMAYQTGDYVRTKAFEKQAVEHHAGMYDMYGDGKFLWKDEIEKKYGPHVPFFTPEIGHDAK